MLKKALMVAAISLGAVVSSPAQGSDDLSRKDVEKIVHDYILQNGGLVRQSLENHALMESMKTMRDVIRPHTPVQGPEDATIVMVEFSDFECPFCRKVQPTLTKLLEHYEGRIKYAFKHTPLLQLHPRAIGAAYASQAAHKQGKFWEYRDKLFERQEFSGEKLWSDVAEEIGLDMEQFNKDRASEEIKAQVEQDMKDGELAGVRGTPFFLINGIPVSGAQPYDNFVAAIEEQLSTADAYNAGK